MTVHDAIPKERGLSVSFTFFMSKPRSGGVLTIRKAESGLSVSYRYLTTLGFCSVGIVESCT